VLACALAVREASGGAFDPCAGELVDLWGFGAHGRHAEPGFAPPSDDAVAAALSRSRALEFDTAHGRIRQPGGLRLDLSGIAKGYAVDAVCALLEARGLHHYLVEIGGELRGAGMKPDGQPWWVTLEEGEGAGETVLALHGLACATSGDYRRFFDYSGRRYAHTLDPRTGRPVEHGVAAATVIGADCMRADAWATALTVLGPVVGIALADREGLAARMLVRDGAALRETTSAAFRAMLD
jgi:thiamine biosynthesis lipoprotein